MSKKQLGSTNKAAHLSLPSYSELLCAIYTAQAGQNAGISRVYDAGQGRWGHVGSEVVSRWLEGLRRRLRSLRHA